MAEKCVPTDWEAVQLAYRLGLRSLRSIGADHGLTEGAIRKRAKKEEWPRDLKAKVKAKAEEMVRKAEVRKQVRKASSPTENQQVEIGARVQSEIILGHRRDVPRARALVMRLLGEAENATKALPLAARATVVKSLADAMRTLIGLEREAFNIGEGDSPPPPSASSGVSVILDFDAIRRKLGRE